MPDSPPERDPEPLEAPPAPAESKASAVDRQVAAESQRVYVDAPVNFRAEGGRAATGFVRDLSMTGMFVATDTLYLTGTEIEFSIRTTSGVLQGVGRVVWQRAAPSHQGLPIGIGVSFDRLDSESRSSIRRLVEGREPQPEPEKIDQLRRAVSDGLDASSDLRPATAEHRGSPERPAVYRTDTPPGRRFPWGRTLGPIALFGLVVLVGAVLQSGLGGESPGAPARRPPADTSRNAPSEAVVAADAQTSADAVTDTEAPPLPSSASTPAPTVASAQGPTTTDLTRAVRQAVDRWAAAWAAQDVDDYLSSYVDDYAPSGRSHEEWRAQRRDRLQRPSVIEVGIEGFAVEPGADASSARASFVQRYRSDQYRDVVRKSLELERQKGAWKIRSERSGPVDDATDPGA